jgi:hypothetical protein
MLTRRTNRVALVMASFVVAVLILLPVRALTYPVGVDALRFAPIDRVIRNLEREYHEHPDSAALAWRLGRLHALAFAEKADSVKVDESVRYTPDGEAKPFEREMTRYVPLFVTETDDATVIEVAKQHLLDAIAWYETALHLKTNDSTMMLGYGWCLERAGRAPDAIRMYRRVINLEFSKPPGQDRQRIVASEALLYLVYLLDPIRDKAEIEERYRQLSTINKTWGTSVSPIVIPLREHIDIDDIVRDNVEVCFDVDGLGRDIGWTWIDPAAGWLVYDSNDSGDIRSGRQLFGDVTCWVFWNNGYEALASLDDDGDQWLRGDELRGLKIWNDRDSNGVCDRSEVRELAEDDIVGLSCEYVETSCNDRRMWMSKDGVEFSNGTCRTSYDVVLTTWDNRRLAVSIGNTASK